MLTKNTYELLKNRDSIQIKTTHYKNIYNYFFIFIILQNVHCA